MKLICTGDFHIRTNRPKYRIDNYKESLFDKLEWILGHIGMILQPGDFFDSPMSPYSLVLEVMRLCDSSFDRETGSPIITIFGQHDLRYHASKDNTPLAILQQSRYVNFPNQFPDIFNFNIYGCSWGEEIPKIVDKETLNILLIHKMIVNEKLWADQEGHTWANHLLTKTGFDLIVSGDNHTSFVVEHNGKLLVNCGSLMRSTTAQKNHKPIIVIYDTNTRRHEIKYIPIKPIEEVMVFNEKEEERNEELESFVKGLSEEREIGLDFMTDLFEFMKTNKIDNSISNFIKECSNE